MRSKKVSILSTMILVLLFLAACGGQEQAAEPTAAPTAVPPTEAPPTEAPPTEVPPTEVPPTAVPATEEPTAEPAAQEQMSPLESMEHEPDPELINITWEWVSRDPNGNDVPEITVEKPENYTLFFNEDGTFNARLDCNNAAGQYKTPTPGSIFMVLGPTTLAACGADSLDADMTNMFGPVQNYRFEDDGNTLVMVWVAGGPIDYFRNAEVAMSSGEEEISAIPPDAIQITTGALASTYDWEVRPGSPIPPGPGGVGYPPHIVVTFDGQTADQAIADSGAIMYIFPTEAYVALYNSAGNAIVADTVTRLEDLIATAADRTTTPESPMPLLPPPSSFMGRWAQFADLDFGDGSGVRYVSEAPNRQGIGPWTNLGTAYYYQGLTTDGRYYVSLRWPVSTAALPNTPDDVSEETLAASTNPDTYPAYLQETIATLDALGPTDWSPSLAAIDSLAASITFPVEESENIEDQEEVELPDAATGEPMGTVTAPDGVFIRTGPGTDYPAIGAAPFEETGKIVGVSEDGLWWVFEVPESADAPNGQGWVSAEFIDAQNADNVPVLEAPPLEPAIEGTNWGWVSTTDPTGETTVDDPASYTILFNTNGSAIIKADCNNVIGSFTLDGNSISIQLGPSTLVACEPGSLDQEFLSQLSNVAIYFFEGEDLYMDLMADGGTMRFAVQTGSGETPPAEESPTGGAEGTLFTVASFGPVGAEQAVLEGTSITALFDETTISGLAGCNNYTGQLTPVDDHFTIGPIVSTLQICDTPAGIMEQEQAYLTALENVNGYQWSSERVSGTSVITSGQLLYTTAENLPGVINLVSQ